MKSLALIPLTVSILLLSACSKDQVTQVPIIDTLSLESEDTNFTQSISSSFLQSASRESIYLDALNIDFQKLEEGFKVLFFTSDWCISCQSLDRSLQSQLSDLPKGLIIIKVDLENSELTDQYNVKVPHTILFIGQDNQELSRKQNSTFQDLLDINFYN